MTKAQAHRSQKLKGYYERQYAKTSANKVRRAAKRARRKVKAKQPNDQALPQPPDGNGGAERKP